MEIGLSLGTNIGDRLANLREARGLIEAIDGVTVTARSRVYETEPVGVQPEHRHLCFLNAVLVIAARIPLQVVSFRLHDIEKAMGRQRSADRNAPRPIDIDLIYGGRRPFDTAPLRLPHPRWAERRFVVQPLADVRPDLILPGQTQSVKQVLLALPETPKVVSFIEEW